MRTLDNLKDTSRAKKSFKRVGRGTGSGLGKTSGRGQNGQGSRSGYKRRYGFEGGQLPLYRRLPTRGFSNARFRKEMDAINLGQVDALYQDGEVVNATTLVDKGFISGKSHGVKLLGNGKLAKKVSFEIDAISSGARVKLQAEKIPFIIKGETED